MSEKTQETLVPEVAAALELIRARNIAEEVRALPVGGKDADMPTPFHAGFQLACEEILARLGGQHDSGCALHNAPAYKPEPCDCSIDLGDFRPLTTDERSVINAAIWDSAERVHPSPGASAEAVPSAIDVALQLADELDRQGRPSGAVIRHDLVPRLRAALSSLPSATEISAGVKAVAEHMPWYPGAALATPPTKQGQAEALVPIRQQKNPCGECHIQPGETCDICGAAHPKADSTEAKLSSSLFETLERIAAFLEIDIEAAKKAPGKPSDVYIAAIQAFAMRAPQARRLTEDKS